LKEEKGIDAFFQDFPGPGILSNKIHSRTVQGLCEPWLCYC